MSNYDEFDDEFYEVFAPYLKPSVRFYRIVVARGRLNADGEPLEVLRPDVLADGAWWPAGHAVIDWPGGDPSVTVYPSLDAVESALEGLDAALYWIDPVPPDVAPLHRRAN